MFIYFEKKNKTGSNIIQMVFKLFLATVKFIFHLSPPTCSGQNMHLKFFQTCLTHSVWHIAGTQEILVDWDGGASSLPLHRVLTLI